MALLPSVATYITVEASRYRSAVSEFLIQTIGKSINYLLDKVDAIESELEGQSFSLVEAQVVSRFAGNAADIDYTVPAGKDFIGYLTATRDITISGATAFTGSVTATTSAPFTMGVYLTATESINVDSGGITTGEVELAGSEISTTTITIP